MDEPIQSTLEQMMIVARGAMRIFAAWAAITIGHIYIPLALITLFSEITFFSWIGEIWILGALGPDVIYYLISGALLWMYFRGNNWTKIVLIVAVLEVLANIFQADFLEFLSSFKMSESYADEFVLNILIGKLIPGFAMPLGAYAAHLGMRLLEYRASGHKNSDRG